MRCLRTAGVAIEACLAGRSATRGYADVSGPGRRVVCAVVSLTGIQFPQNVETLVAIR